jgi:hypothetical protein
MATKTYHTTKKVANGNAYGATKLNEQDASVANIDKSNQEYKTKTKTSGIKIRGTGAAKRGIMARGPMA